MGLQFIYQVETKAREPDNLFLEGLTKPSLKLENKEISKLHCKRSLTPDKTKKPQKPLTQTPYLSRKALILEGIKIAQDIIII